MKIPPIPPSPGGGPAPWLKSVWPRFTQLVQRFWQAMEAEEWEVAQAALDEMLELAFGRAALMAIYEECAAALTAALEVLGGIAELGSGGGIIIVIVIIGLWAIGGGSQPAYADSGGIVWRPLPVRKSEEEEELERILFSHPQEAGRLINAPKAHHLSRKAQVAAARMLLKRMKGRK